MTCRFASTSRVAHGPRAFESWKEIVRGQSTLWTSVEQRSAADMASDPAALIAAGEINRLNQKLEHLATSDHLTGLWYRHRIEEAIDHEVSMTERYGRPCALVMFDIDRFKRFNDTWGHYAGDDVLAKVARIVSTQLWDTDRVRRGAEKSSSSWRPTPPLRVHPAWLNDCDAPSARLSLAATDAGQPASAWLPIGTTSQAAT